MNGLNIRSVALVLLLLPLSVSAAMTQQRPKVVVQFERLADNYRQYGANVDSAAASRIATQLQQHIGYVNFLAPGGRSSNELRIKLNRAPNGEVWLSADLFIDGEQVDDRLSRWISFDRKPGGNRHWFLSALADSISSNRATTLANDLLREVRIVQHPGNRRFRVQKTPLGWLLPFTDKELCMDLRSKLRIHNEVELINGRRRPIEFFAHGTEIGRDHILVQPQEGANRRDLDALRNGKPVSMEVYITDYRRLRSCAHKSS